MSRRLIPLAVGLVALAVVLALDPGNKGHLPVPASTAVHAAEANPTVAKQLAGYGYDHQRVTRLDDESDRVAFFDGPRIRAVVAVDQRGQVRAIQTFRPGSLRYGSSLSDSPWLLALLALGFLATTATTPFLSLRNLDALALLAFGIPIVAGDHQLFSLSVLSGYPPLAYLCARCAWRAAKGPATRPAEPLISRLHGRYVAYGIAGCALLLAAIAVGSPSAMDVGFASSAGATLLLHGTLPYGHMPPGVVHGDTYPLLSYVLYIPAAAISPVRNAFDDTSGALLVGFAATLLTALCLKRFGARMTLAWLCFPPVAVAVAAGTNDLLLAAALAAALALASRPGRSALALAAGAWIKLAPIALIPIWLAHTRGRPLLRALAAGALVTAALSAWILIIGGPAGFGHMLHALSFQLDRGTLQSAWALLGAEPLQRAVQAATLGGIAWAALAARDNPARLVPLSGAVLAALQLAASNWTYLYAVWLFPAAALALLSEGATPDRAAQPTRTGRRRAAR
jgi:hypothetical protein